MDGGDGRGGGDPAALEHRVAMINNRVLSRQIFINHDGTGVSLRPVPHLLHLLWRKMPEKEKKRESERERRVVRADAAESAKRAEVNASPGTPSPKLATTCDGISNVDLSLSLFLSEYQSLLLHPEPR